MGDLALTNIAVGDKAAAFAFVEKGMAAVPIEKDALDGPGAIEILARVSVQMGEPRPCCSSIAETALDTV